MKTSIFLIAFFATFTINAQTNSGGTSVPNSGANTTPPPMQTYPKPSDNLANPSNSTVPGASGSYSVEPGKPELQNPGANGSYTTYPTAPQPVITPTNQTGSSMQQNKKKKEKLTFELKFGEGFCVNFFNDVF